MLAHKFMSFSEACTMLSCTNDDLRRWVMEDRTLTALLVSPSGYSRPFELRGLQLYEVSDAGAVTDWSNGRAAGHLRFEKAVLIRHLAEWPHAKAAAVQPATELRPATPAPVVAVGALDDTPPTNWRHLIQAEAYQYWLRLRASGCNPTPYSICGDMAKWCIEKNIKGGKGQNPTAGTIRNTVLCAGHWTPPHHSVAEAKKHIAQIA